MSPRGSVSSSSIAGSSKGADVTDIEWEAPKEGADGPGLVTIGHAAMENVNMPMTQDAARRLADRMFGYEKTEIPLSGEGVHWIRMNTPLYQSKTS
jgi:hypothetical protein